MFCPVNSCNQSIASRTCTFECNFPTLSNFVVIVNAGVVLQHTYEFRKKDGHRVKEDVGASVKDNVVQYHLKDEDGEVWVVDDFNRVSRRFQIPDCNDGNEGLRALQFNRSRCKNACAI